MIPFSPPRIDQKIIDEVTAALRSGWITTGPRTKSFEEKITAYLGHRKTLCVNAATNGMELALRWFGVGEGDEVILPAYTYCATANVVEHCGAKPVLVDCGEDFNLDPQALKALITPRTKAIMPVDIGGYPCDYEAIMALAEEVKGQFNPGSPEQEKLGRILVLADAAHSLGAKQNGKYTGTLADISVFSFHAVKNLSTAEGGAIAFNLPDDFDCDEIYRYFNTLSLHGQSKDALAKFQKGGWRYDVIAPGYKCNMTDIQAAIGLVEIERYESETLPRRREIFDFYSQAFAKYDWALTPTWTNEENLSSCHVYMLRIKGFTEAQRDQLIEEVTAQGVSVNVHFQPLPILTAYRERGYQMTDYPRAYALYSQEMSLPVFFDLSLEDAGKVVEAVAAGVEKVLSLTESHEASL